MKDTKPKGKNGVKTVGRLFLLALISLVIGVRLYSWNAQVLGGNAMPMPFGYGVTAVLSGSMEPVLSVNDLVIVHAQETYEPGDIVVYQSGHMLVLHRLVALEDGMAVTQGDANNMPDPPIAVSAIKGKAIAQAPGLGAVGLFLKTPAGSVMVLAAAVLLFELPYWRERQKAAEEQERIKEEIRRLKGE